MYEITHESCNAGKDTGCSLLSLHLADPGIGTSHPGMLLTDLVMVAQVAAPAWATTTAPAPAISAPAVGIQFIMSGVSAAQLNKTLLRCVDPGFRTWARGMR